MKKINQKDIIMVQSEWTNNEKLYYLVVFADSYNPWMSAIRLQPNTHEMSSLVIPPNMFPEYCMFSDGGAYVNVFTGITSIRENNVKEVIGYVTDDIYANIISGIVAAFTGNYISKGRYYMVKKMTAIIPSSMIFKSIIFYSPSIQKRNVNDTDPNYVPQSSCEYQQIRRQRYRSTSGPVVPSHRYERRTENKADTASQPVHKWSPEESTFVPDKPQQPQPVKEEKTENDNVIITDDGWHTPATNTINGVNLDTVERIFNEYAVSINNMWLLPMDAVVNNLNDETFEIKDDTIFINWDSFFALLGMKDKLINKNYIDLFFNDGHKVDISTINGKDLYDIAAYIYKWFTEH